MRFSLGKAMRYSESSPSLVSLYPPISSVSGGGIRKMVIQIPSIDVIFMGYWMAGQVSTMMSSVM